MLNTDEPVIGLVDAFGSGAGCIGNAEQWTLVFYLAAWKSQDGAVTQQRQRCEMPVEKSAVEHWMRQVRAYSQHTLHVQGETASGAVLVRSITPCQAADADLKRIADDLQIPVRLDTPEFGVLEREKCSDQFEGTALWNGSEINLLLRCADPESPQAVISLAAGLFQAQQQWHRRISDFALSQLLPLKNEHWLGEDEAQCTAADFLSRMKLLTIEIDDAGDFTFWHEDGELFFGHAIEVRGNLVDGPTDADIPG
jgi:hypothetical protein